MKKIVSNICIRTALLISAGAVIFLAALSMKGVGELTATSEAPTLVKDAKNLTDAEWRKRLTPEQYRILREAGTERAFGKTYKDFRAQEDGDYYCAGCGAKLFSSTHKFDSHCGWPSFYDPATIDSVETREDISLGMKRIEVVCRSCKGHLGHRFDGEGFDTPTNQRYCINGSALVFVPADGKRDVGP